MREWPHLYGNLQWAAGFIDGDGSMGISRKALSLTASQKGPELLDKLKTLFGGSVRKERTKNLYAWSLHGQSDIAALLMTLYPLLSHKRQETIRQMLTVWKANTYRYLTCKKGHPWTDKTTYRYTLRNGTIRRWCAICHLANQKRYRSTLRLQSTIQD